MDMGVIKVGPLAVVEDIDNDGDGDKIVRQ